jgi:hypothetical protein
MVTVAVEVHVDSNLVDALKPYMHLLNMVEVGRREDHGITVVLASAPSAPEGAATAIPTFARRGDKVLLHCIEWLDVEGGTVRVDGSTNTPASRRW